jgi:hypothetical protein
MMELLVQKMNNNEKKEKGETLPWEHDSSHAPDQERNVSSEPQNLIFPSSPPFAAARIPTAHRLTGLGQTAPHSLIAN